MLKIGTAIEWYVCKNLNIERESYVMSTFDRFQG